MFRRLQEPWALFGITVSAYEGRWTPVEIQGT